MSRSDVDVVVVGGGGVGSAAAWQLARRGRSVVLLEQFAAGHTRGASHGASRIFRLSYPDRVYIDLAREARELWRELENTTGTALLTVTGGVDHGDDPQLDVLAAGLGAAGVPHSWLTPDEAAERWPGIRFDTRALFHPDSGRLHADRSVRALQSAAASAGALVRHETPVTSIEVLGDDTVLVHTDTGSYRARRVVAAVNAWANALVGALVPLPPLRVTQEQPAHFRARLPEDTWPSFGHRVGGAYGGTYGLATPGEGIKVGFHGVGPEVDPDHRDYAPEPAQLAALREYARTWVPGVDPDTFTPISCTYTTTPDADFVLDRVGPVVVATGFSGHGFKFLPALGRVLADLALDGTRPDRRFAAHPGGSPRTATGASSEAPAEPRQPVVGL
ncbi:FAD-dependent oxidoreductase [Cryptosporangium japonicum]|uniref:N-methyl-L-tryptophan oxidase n=1 Tax=Cryptosporangium japonicum TaxID=80872 RepID=A0ABN0U8U9_9ACTN